MVTPVRAPDHEPPARRRGLGGRHVMIIAVLAILLPIALDLATDPRNGLFRYSASDAFYYHTIARNFSTLGFPTFDQEFPTNGFHPLWQLVLTALYGLCCVTGLGERVYLLASIAGGALLLGGAVWNLGAALEMRYGRVTGLLPFAAIGPYALFVVPLWHVALDVKGFVSPFEGPEPLYGTMWSYANGMESALSIFLFSVLVRRAAANATERLDALKDGALLAVLILSRLDLALVAGGIFAAGLVRAAVDSTGSSLRAAVSRIAPSVVLIGLYLIVNRLYAGAAFPISGAMKSHFPYPTWRNWDALLATLDDPVANTRTFWKSWRIFQMFVPPVAAVGLMLPFVVRRRARTVEKPPADAANGASTRVPRYTPLDELLLGAGAGVIVLAAYDIAFVDALEQGHWYFAVSNFWLSCMVMVLASRLESERIDAFVAYATAACGALVFVTFHVRRDHHQGYAHLYYETAPKVRAMYGSHPPKIVEFDDGIIAFSTGFKALSGFGFGLDLEAARALAEGKLVRVAVARRYDRIASFTYGNPHAGHLGEGDPEAASRAIPPAWKEGIHAIGKEEWVSSDDKLAIIKYVILPGDESPTP